MCGLVGAVFNDRNHLFSEAQTVIMRDAIAHRGPDDAGLYLAPGVMLGSRRLAIQDLSERGHMPMATPDGRYQIAYNGEVYNFSELRNDLEARGHRFRSMTDTEVLLHSYIEYGPQMLDRLNGMFAFAIWDNQERRLFAARDRMGVKPLYYAERPEGVYFASEEKSLFLAGVPAIFNEQTWEELLCFRYVAGERTPFVGVNRLLPGHYLIWQDGKLQTRRWWNLAERAQALANQNPDDAVAWFRDMFDSAVAYRRISDVPIGVLLSGGLDSSSVAASLASQTGAGVKTFTVRFDEAEYDEGPLAQQVAEKWQINYHELKVSERDLLPRLQQASWLNDEPLVHGNDLHLFAISEYAKPKVTVLLSGEGADETLGGYVRYRPLQHPLALKMARPAFALFNGAERLSGRAKKLARFLTLGSIDRFVLFNSCEVLPSELNFFAGSVSGGFPFREQMLAEAQAAYPGDPLRQAMYNDQHTFLCSILDRNDRMTMGASIECRVPFLDYRLVEGLAAMPTKTLISRKQSKHLLREAIGERLPEAVRTHRKWGFAVPWSRYFRETPQLKNLVEQLPTLDPLRDGPFARQKLQSLIQEFLAGDDQYAAIVRQLVMIAVWHQTYFSSVKEKAHRAVAA